jgi:hypothetical protein
MADENKIYKKLPSNLQTTAIKNFFESTVEQLFSKSEVDQIQGYIGSPRSEDVGVTGKFITEPTTTKKFYALTPTVNTINSVTGESENLVFYDELIDTLATYGVDVLNHNKVFSENFASFLPPINIDKFLNYQEYYWFPRGPSTIEVTGTQADFIDIDQHILGNAHYTPVNGKAFRNGMIVKFTGDYVTPENKKDIEYIVNGVGESIFFTQKNINVSTRFTMTSYTSSSIDLVYKTVGSVSDNVTYTAPQSSDEDVGLPTVYINGSDAPGERTEIKNITVGSLERYNGVVSLSDGTTEITVDYTSAPPVSIIQLVSDLQNATGYNDLLFTVEVATRLPTDYIVQERGAANENHWSRVNYWFHRNNFVDAGDTLPNRSFRAERPIIEFDKDLEIYQHGLSKVLCCVLANAYNLKFADLDGMSTDLNIDGVPTNEYPRMIFSNEETDVAKYIYKAYPVTLSQQVMVTATDSGNVNIDDAASFTVTMSGKGRESEITAITVTDGGSGYTSSSNVSVSVTGLYTQEATATATVVGGEITAINVTNGGKGYYQANQYRVEKVGTEESDALGYAEGDEFFEPRVASVGNTVQIRAGETQVGKEFFWNGIKWASAQEKLAPNQPPLFNLYSPEGYYLGDTAIYPESTFAGNKIFGYAENVPANAANIFKGTNVDPELNRTLVYKMFNAQSEILFENFIETETYSYRPPGITSSLGITLGAENLNGPYSIEGYYPLYSNIESAKSSGNGTYTEHVFYGKTFYMPNGLELGVTYFLGNYTGNLTPDFTTINSTNTTVAGPATVYSSTSSGSGGNTY